MKEETAAAKDSLMITDPKLLAKWLSIAKDVFNNGFICSMRYLWWWVLHEPPLPTVCKGNETLKSGKTIRKKERIKGSKRYGHDIESMLLAESRVKRRRRRGRESYETQQEQQQPPHLLGPMTNADYVNKLTSALLTARLVQKFKSNKRGVSNP